MEIKLIFLSFIALMFFACICDNDSQSVVSFDGDAEERAASTIKEGDVGFFLLGKFHKVCNLVDIASFQLPEKIEVIVPLSGAESARTALLVNGYDIVDEFQYIADGDSPKFRITAERGFLERLHGNVERRGNLASIK